MEKRLWARGRNISMTTLSYSVAGTRLQPSRQGEAPHQAGQERRDLDSTVLPLLPRKYRSATAARARLWLVGVALGALAFACCSCAAPISNDAKLHLAASPEDFKALGIGKEIEVREDGRSTPKSSDYFEWWYFDGLFDDGTVFVVWFGDNWLYGSHKRALNIDLTLPGKPPRHIMRTFDDPGAFSTDHADVQIGPHTFKGNLETYAIRVDAAETGGVGCNLTLRRRVASYRPATGYMEAGGQLFPRAVAAPEGAAAGALTPRPASPQVPGTRCHDTKLR